MVFMCPEISATLGRQKYADRPGITISCIIQANQKEGVRPEQTAVSSVKGLISFAVLLKITQEGGGGEGAPLSLHTMEGLFSKKHALSADLNRHVGSPCVSGFQLFALLVCILVS